MLSSMLSGRACHGIVAALTGRACQSASAIGVAGHRHAQRAAFSSEPPQQGQGEELSEEAKAALEAKAKRKAAEEQAGRVKEFVQSRKAFKVEMSNVRKGFMQEASQQAAQEMRTASKDTATAEQEAKARKDARRARALANIEAHEAKADAARLDKVKDKESKAERRLQREAFLSEAAELRRELLAHQSRTWVREDELDDRITLALKYPENLR